ncbi:MAG: fimbrillin family protein [Muribaculum sp.]|nr:fimbrillin family protein [Muribaculum sp.]
MKTAIKHIITYSLPLMLAACAEDTIDMPGAANENMPIRLGAAYPTASRASDAGFEDGDNMGVYVMDYQNDTPQEITGDDIHADNVKFKFNGSDNSWSGATEIYWTSNTTPVDIIGYYPFMSTIDDETSVPFSIARRQDLSGNENEPGGYEASDFLWAKALKVMPTSSRVNLTFSHLMAGVRITLAEGDGFAAGEWATLKKNVLVSNIIPSATINLAEGTVTGVEGSPISVTPYKHNEDWRAIVIPQKVSAGEIIAVSVDGISYKLIREEGITYQGGKLHSFTITVNKLTSTGDYEFNLSDEAISAWIDDVEFRDGIVRNYLTVNVERRGALKNIIASMGLSPATISSLKLTGEINEEDFRFMREECTALKSLNLSEVKSWDGEREDVIPANAMKEKSTLSHIVFPNSLKIIGSGSFYNCGLMGTLIIPEGVIKIGENPFSPDNAGAGGTQSCFTKCSNLVGELILPSTLEFIEDDAFYGTKFTGELHLPKSLRTIGNGAFALNKFSGTLTIPENIENIGGNAFMDIPFSGSLIIPKNIKTIYGSTFKNCGFNSNLFLPEGLKVIEREAFGGCGFKGELNLPSTLQRISNLAFVKTKITGIVFPKNLSYIGDGAFMLCQNLRGKIEIPERVERINPFLFAGCPQITGLTLPEGIISVGGAAVYGCISLNAIICNSIDPPIVSHANKNFTWDWGWDIAENNPIGPFDGISKNNFTLEVPEESVDLYRRAEGWKEFSRISVSTDFVCRPSTACALNTRHSETIVLDSDGEWEITAKPEWCEVNKSEGSGKEQIVLTITEMPKGSGNRNDYVEFTQKATGYTTRCEVSQYDYQYGEDECVTLQKASKGNGIDILFLGDGWDAASIADGSYLSLVNEQMEDFFGVEPYLTYRDRFNVYACISLSQETGVNTRANWRNTRFSTLYGYDCDGVGSLQPDNVDDIFDYAVSHTPMTAEKMPRSLVILTLNSDEYGSATTLTENGSAVAICSPSVGTYPMDTRGIIQHEAGGHAFGKLAEERVTKNRYISDTEKTIIMSYQRKRWFQNISLSGKMTDVAWNHFILDPRYSNSVDIFEGAYGKARGAYRCEINSCMNYGIPYFNAISRQDIVRRILEYSGEGFTMEKFYANDSDKWGTTSTSRAAMVDDTESYVASGSHHPVRIVKSNKY